METQTFEQYQLTVQQHDALQRQLQQQHQQPVAGGGAAAGGGGHHLAGTGGGAIVPNGNAYTLSNSGTIYGST